MKIPISKKFISKNNCLAGKKTHTKPLIICSTLAACLSVPISSIAAVIDWHSVGGSTEWGAPENWSNGLTPQVPDKVGINQNRDQGPVINSGHFNIDSLTVGASADGSLIIQAGELTTSTAYIGAGEGINGSVTVTGKDSILNITNFMFMGNSSGNGSLTIENGGTVNALSESLYMGIGNPGGVDHLTVSGEGSSLNLNSWLLLAYGGNSSFNDTTSIVQVKDGATITAEGIDVGYGGHGVLNIDGGQIDTKDALMAPYIGSKAEVTITGPNSRWSTDKLSIAGLGDANLIVKDGGLLESANTDIASNTSGTAVVSISDSNSRWLNTNNLRIGVYGNANVIVKDGSSVSVGGDGEIGVIAGSKGILEVSGANWDNAGSLYIGYLGNGTLRVNNGGTVSTGGFGLIGVFSGSEGLVEISGVNSSWNNTAPLYVGYYGKGILRVNDGGTVSTDNYGVIGGALNSEGLVEISGVGSNWHNAGVYIGNSGNGVLTITNGGSVFARESVVIAADVDSSGVLNIGASVGQIPTYPGMLDTPSISFGAGNGSIVFNHSDNSGSYVFSAPIDGTGVVDFYSGNTVLSGQSSYQGPTTIHNGIISTIEDNVLSPNSAYDILPEGRLDLKGHNNHVLSINNSGFLRIAGAPQYVGAYLTTSTYTSNGGVLELNTTLGADNSATDKLIAQSITLGNQPTTIFINNIQGQGAATNKGIMIVEALDASKSEKNTFILGRPVIAGAYEYVLTQDDDNKSWYLSNNYKDIPLFNPALGAYLANQTAASALFMHTLYDRQGQANNIAGGSEKRSPVWVRAATSNTKNNSVNGNMGVNTDSNLIHLGGDVGKWQVQEGNLHLGLMGAYGQTESDVKSKKTGTTAKGKVTGYSVGLYGTWFADEAQGKGLYVDSWAQYDWYKNKVSGQGQTQKEEKYDSNNWAASLEAGYGMHLATQGNTEIMLTPQVQVTYNNYSADDHQDRNNLKVSGSKADDVITRVGARLYGRAIEGYSAKPFIEANWIHHTAKNELSFNGEVLKDGVPKDRAEAKLGLQGTISKSWKVWGQVGAQWGGANYTRYEGQAGLNYQW